ncbi:cytochrome P450 [Phellopilus nigrolimitatus]|nr:cytochrome P450 [Phellopilus nigrolimitatus]
MASYIQHLWLSTAICIILGAAFFIKKRRKSEILPFPPGPSPWPLLGNLLDMPRTREWETITEWSRIYGEVVHVKVFGQHIIFVNTPEAADELFEKRSAVYSDRPRSTLINDLMGHGEWNFAFFPYGETWRAYRRLFMSKFGPNSAHLYRPVQEFVTHQLLKRLLIAPENFLDHLRLHAGQLIMKYTYGIDVTSCEDRYVHVGEAVMHSISEAAKPGYSLVDAFPFFLKLLPEWIPGASHKRRAREWAQVAHEMRWAPFLDARNRLSEGKSEASPSFVSNCLEELGPESERMILDCAALAYGGGSDTTVVAFEALILAMVLYPECQKKAQLEIDTIVGSSRLPTFADKSFMPYVTAITKEVVRWHTVTPQGLPHSLAVDDVYNGYLITAGSIVVGNVWGNLHNPDVYPDPMKFIPERFIDAEGKFSCATNDPARFLFGFGRRVCGGRQFAEDILWITAAQTLSAFNINPAVDSSGNTIIPSTDCTSGLVSHPVPFKCNITPRSEEATLFIQQSDDTGLSK